MVGCVCTHAIEGTMLLERETVLHVNSLTRREEGVGLFQEGV